MSKRTSLLASLAALVLGFAVGAAAAKNPTDSKMFVGKDKKEAAAALLAAAHAQAGGGSWEKIAVGRLYYRSGQKEEGQRILDSVVAKKAEAGDWVRIGRVYYEAGEWEKAKAAFDKVLALKPADEDWLAEIGAYYLVKGDRQHAEELFARSLKEDNENVNNTLRMAGAYLGLAPQE
jgi:tetratricopeptide (TPR) repeat protein